MHRIAIAFVVTLILASPAPPAFAQTTGFGEPLGWIFVSDDNTAYSPCIVTGSFVPFTVYVVVSLSYSYVGEPVLDAKTGIQAWEASVDIPGLGGDVLIHDAVIRNESINIGRNTNVIAGLYPAVVAADTPIDLVEYTLVLLAAGMEDVILTIGPSSPSSFRPARPGFAESADVGECTNPVTGEGLECKRAFARISPAVINDVGEFCYVPPATEERSWSAIKAQYSR